jgi:hypothetical protein
LQNNGGDALSYSLTERQQDLLRWLVGQINEHNLPEEFRVFWEVGGASIGEFKGQHPEITKGMLDALNNAGLLLCAPEYVTIPGDRLEICRRCTITGAAFKAVEADFESQEELRAQVTIGAIINSMSGGTLQAVGIVQDAEISQVVNDPQLLRSQVEALTENLVNEVKSTLSADELADYSQAVQELREQVLARQPETQSIRRLVRTVGLLGDIEGTIGLMVRVWTLLHPLLLIVAAILG